MKVLAIDTSNEVLGLAVIDQNRVIGEFSTNLNKNHSVRLMPAIEYLLNECKVSPSELERIVVAEGPGSYTGVRIGVTVAKTMAWSLSIPLIGVSSLAMIAANAHNFRGIICPLFDARRNLIYTGLYQYNQDGILMEIKEDTNILITDWLEELQQLNEPVLFIGNDVEIHRELINEKLKENAHFATMIENSPRASELVMLASNEQENEIHSFTPNYIRLVEAEAKWLENQVKNDE